jgi:hypothetical protein
MLPEPTAGKSAAARGRPQPGVMTPLFAVPGGTEPDLIPPDPPDPPGPRGPRGPAAGRRVRPAARARRASPRLPAADSGPHKDTADLLTVTAERLRRALGRSFLRYGIASDLEAAVHAAMNVIEPVLDARDTEILRLRRMMAGKVPGKSSR